VRILSRRDEEILVWMGRKSHKVDRFSIPNIINDLWWLWTTKAAPDHLNRAHGNVWNFFNFLIRLRFILREVDVYDVILYLLDFGFKLCGCFPDTDRFWLGNGGRWKWWRPFLWCWLWACDRTTKAVLSWCPLRLWSLWTKTFDPVIWENVSPCELVDDPEEKARWYRVTD